MEKINEKKIPMLPGLHTVLVVFLNGNRMVNTRFCKSTRMGESGSVFLFTKRKTFWNGFGQCNILIFLGSSDSFTWFSYVDKKKSVIGDVNVTYSPFKWVTEHVQSSQVIFQLFCTMTYYVMFYTIILK